MYIIGYYCGAVTSFYISDNDFSTYTLNCIDQNITLKEMAVERFTDDYKLRFNDWKQNEKLL